MSLSRANIPLASEDRTHGQAKSPSSHYNLAPHFRPGFINLQHFCHSRWRNPVPLSKSGIMASISPIATSINDSERRLYSLSIVLRLDTCVPERMRLSSLEHSDNKPRSTKVVLRKSRTFRLCR